jgi:N-acetylglutamate synthase-like GNAT family acetyltransferase
VVAVGTCASSGGIFRECYNVSGGVDSVIPVDVYVPGCAARPEAIIDGVVQALSVLEEKHRAMKAIANSVDKVLYQRAEKTDAPEILALQKIAYQSEAEIYGDNSLPALQQTLDELQKDFEGAGSNGAAQADQVTFLKAVVNGKIIASARAYSVGDSAYVKRVVVHPYFQRRGIGGRLVGEIEQAFSHVKRFEVFTGSKSERTLKQFRKLGYEEFKTEQFTPAITWVYMQKERS